MPELPDLTVYLEHLERRVVGERLLDIRLASPFVLRSVTPSVEDVRDRLVTGTRRVAKQLVLALEPDLFVVVHLMISGRLRWYARGRAVPKRAGSPPSTSLRGRSSSRRRARRNALRCGSSGARERSGNSTRGASRCSTSTWPRSWNACAGRGTR